jgi:SAM-dependent methyltransferase
MKQTAAHDTPNPDLLAMMPAGLARVVEVGCSTGALARAYRAANPACDYIGIEIDPDYAVAAAAACSSVVNADVERLDAGRFGGLFPSDCWVFGDSLEHLKDPWALLARIRARLAPDAAIVACIPNAQHWSIQAKLNRGLIRYEDAGLLDRTHLRWFTRLTMQELFVGTGYDIVAGVPRIFDEPGRDLVLPAIRAMAAAQGGDPELAVTDALALQYVVRAVPRPGWAAAAAG